MAVPKKKISYSRKKKRLHTKKSQLNQHNTSCTNCGSIKLMHHICTECGFYERLNRKIYENR